MRLWCVEVKCAKNPVLCHHFLQREAFFIERGPTWKKLLSVLGPPFSKEQKKEAVQKNSNFFFEKKSEKQAATTTFQGRTRGGDSASASGLHSGTPRGSDHGFRTAANEGGDIVQKVALVVSQIKEKTAVVCQALLQERIHEHMVDPSFPRSVFVGCG